MLPFLIVEWICMLALFVLFFITVFCIIKSLPPSRRKRLKSFRTTERQSYSWYGTLESMRLVPRINRAKEYVQLLKQLGQPLPIEIYFFLKRALLTALCVLLLVAVYFAAWIEIQFMFSPLYIQIVFIIGWLILYADKLWLSALASRRRSRMTADIFVLSRQLLYFADSRMNLHTKLMHCIPFASILKDDMYKLVNEWYEGPKEALERFKQRVSTNEGYSFAETLYALHQYEDASYYELLKDRVRDYKEKIEVEKDSKKESASYVLFLLAGVPILYTFRVFIYPWVAEGQHIFQTLN